VGQVDSQGIAIVGMDDFGQRLVGSIDAIQLPKVGSHLKQGGNAWSLMIEGKTIHMLSPVEAR